MAGENGTREIIFKGISTLLFLSIAGIFAFLFFICLPSIDAKDNKNTEEHVAIRKEKEAGDKDVLNVTSKKFDKLEARMVKLDEKMGRNQREQRAVNREVLKSLSAIAEQTKKTN